MKLINVLTAVVFLYSSVLATEKVKSMLFIEHLCKFSRGLFELNFTPIVYDEVKDKISLKIYPCGKSSYTRDLEGNAVFVCQHGDIECFGNKCIACANSKLADNQDDVYKFTNCAMLKGVGMEGCYELVNLDRIEIEECANSKTGEELMIKICDVSDNVITYAHEKIPDIVLDGKWSETNNVECQTDFKACIEKNLAGKEATTVPPVEE